MDNIGCAIGSDISSNSSVGIPYWRVSLPDKITFLPEETIREIEEKFDPGAVHPHHPDAVGIKIRQSLAEVTPNHNLKLALGVLFFLVLLAYNLRGQISFSTTTLVVGSIALVLLFVVMLKYFDDITWLVIRPDCVYFRRIHGIHSDKRRVPKEEITQILYIKHHVDEADPANAVLLQLSSGERMRLYEAGRNPLNAEWLVDILHDTLGAPVDGEVQRSLSLRLNQAEDTLQKQASSAELTTLLSGDTSLRTEKPEEVVKAPLAEAPYSFATVRPGSKAYARFLEKLPPELGERARTESVFVVMQDCRSFVLPIILCFFIFLALLMLLFSRRGFSASDLVISLILVVSLPLMLLRRRWYGFFPDKLVVCERVLSFRIKWQIDRNSIHSVFSEPDTNKKNGESFWQVNLVLTNGASILFSKIHKAKSAKWLADVIRIWMGSR